MQNAWQQCDSNPGPSAYDVKSQSVVLLDQIYVGHFNVDRALRRIVTFDEGRHCCKVT